MLTNIQIQALAALAILDARHDVTLATVDANHDAWETVQFAREAARFAYDLDIPCDITDRMGRPIVDALPTHRGAYNAINAAFVREAA